MIRVSDRFALDARDAAAAFRPGASLAACRTPGQGGWWSECCETRRHDVRAWTAAFLSVHPVSWTTETASNRLSAVLRPFRPVSNTTGGRDTAASNRRRLRER